jgi:hypothetical protein
LNFKPLFRRTTMPTNKLNAAKVALKRKEAELDALDDQLMGMPEMAPEGPMDMGGTSPEFDMLSEKREELEEEIQHMREGIQLINEWEKLKGGQWSEDIKTALADIDPEIAGIADGVGADTDMGMGAEPLPGGEMTPEVPPEPALPPAPEEAPLPETPEVPAPAPEAAEPAPEAAPVAAPMASKSPISKKNSYQSPVKKAVSSAKEGSTMDKQTPKASLKDKLAEIKTKREGIKREAQVRVAAAWTIAKTMLPSAPAPVQQAFASTLLQNPTKVLHAALRQTAKNTHYSKIAETFKEVHKVEMNDLLEDPSILHAERKAAEAELHGEAKNATAKVADDRKDAGPQTETYNDGRGHGGGPKSEPKEMDAGGSASQTESEHRPMDTINKSEGDKAGKEASAKPKAACAPCEAKTAAECPDCGNVECKCAASKKEARAKKAEALAAPAKPENATPAAPAKPEATPIAASAKTAQEPAMSEPPADMPPPDMPADMGGAEEAPMDAMPAGEAPVEPPVEGEENAGEMLTEEKKVLVEEKIDEAQEAIRALEQEILEEGNEELDLSKVFGEEGEGSEEMEEKVSALANEGDEHMAAEDYFAPSAAETMEASLDEPQLASMEDFFSLQGSDADPLASLIAGERIVTAADVAGHDVLESFTGEAAKHFEQKETGKEDRDNESDHDKDLFAEAMEGITPEDQGAKRTPQDAVNELESPKSTSYTAGKKEAPKAAAKTAAAKPAEKKATPVVKKIKPVVASAQPPAVDIGRALFGAYPDEEEWPGDGKPVRR